MEKTAKTVCEISISDGVWLIVGFILALLPPFWDRKRQRNGCKASLKAEIRHCGKTACDFLTAEPFVKAPLYRLPLVAWKNAYPVLLAAGVFKENQVERLHKFYSAVETFNRGLDLADAARDNETKLDEEVGRLQLKAKAISSCSDLYSTAVKALDGL